MKVPLVSIVTPCYNGEDYLKRFFDSVLSQTYPNLELVLINDGSKDRTEDIICSYRKRFEERSIRFIDQYQDNAGQAAALKRGLKLMSGEYFSCVDSDDELMPEYVEKKVMFLQNNSNEVYCYGKAIAVNEEEPEKIIATFEKRISHGRYDFFKDILYSKDVFFSGYMIKTSAFDAVMGREIYSGPGGQNAQILLPLGWYYGEPGYVEESVYKYYVRKSSHSHSQNTSDKIIGQLYNYENILVFTLKKISDVDMEPYIDEVKQYYAKIRFGNAVDTKNKALIQKHYMELVAAGGVTIHDFMLYIKYTNDFARKIFRVGR